MSHSREYDREYHRKYRESHPEKMAEYNRSQMERRRARRVVRQGVCARCGKTFEVGIGQRMTKYCSHTCMKRGEIQRQKEKRQAAQVVRVLTCPICGRTFATKDPRKKYCSRNCKKANEMRVWRARKKANGGEALMLLRNEEVSASSRRDKSVASPLLKTCAVCGKEFTAVRCTVLTCSRECSQKHYKATHPVVKPPKASRPKVERRDSFGLTREQRLAVIAAQDGDRDALWKASQSWTPAQHRYAKARWEAIHPTHQEFSWGRY